MRGVIVFTSFMSVVVGCSSSDAGNNADGGTDSATMDGAVSDGSVVVEDGGVLVIDPRDPVLEIAPQDPLILLEEARDTGDMPGDALVWKRTETTVVGEFCLGLNGEAASGTQVVATACTEDAQRWLTDAGALMPANNSSLCVDIDIYASEQPSLAPCDERRTDLALDNNFLVVTRDDGERRTITPFVFEGKTELVAWNMLAEHANWFWRSKLHDLDEALIATLEAELTDEPPAYPHPANEVEKFNAARAQHALGQVLPPYPGVEIHPSALAGEVSSDAPPHSVKVYFDRHHTNPSVTRAYWSTPADWQATGVYAPPGATLAIRVPSDAEPGLEVLVNVHTDELLQDSPNLTTEQEFRRPTRVSSRMSLQPGMNFVRTAFGGSVVLVSHAPSDRIVPIEIHGGVQQARFVRGVTDDATWMSVRNAEAPWAIIEGDRAVVVVPRSDVLNLAEPTLVAERYDRAVELERELAGFDDSAPEHLSPSGKFWLVTDRQITAGYGHSGNPVMVVTAWNLARQDDFGDGWGVWHELGHNHQQFSHWSSRFGVEVTCNIYSLYAQQHFGGGHDLEVKARAVAAELKNASINFDARADVFEQLVFLAQPAWAFPDKGFLLYQRVNQATRELSEDEANAIAQAQPAQVDHLYLNLSRAAEHDLAAHFEAWGLRPSQSARETIASEALPSPPSPPWLYVAPGISI